MGIILVALLVFLPICQTRLGPLAHGPLVFPSVLAPVGQDLVIFHVLVVGQIILSRWEEIKTQALQGHLGVKE